MNLKRRVAVLLLVLIIAKLAVVAQQVDYRTFQPENSSCELLDKVNNQYGNKPEFQELIKAERVRLGYINSKEDLDSHLVSFNRAISLTREQQQTRELLNKTGGEVIKTSVQILTNYADFIPAKHVTKTLIPIINKATDLVVDKYVNDQIKTDRTQLDELIRNRINLLYSNGTNVTSINDEQRFASLFSVATADVSALNRDDYPVFNKELIKYAFQFISQNRESIRLLDLKQTGQYEKVLQETRDGIAQAEIRITQTVLNEFAAVGKSFAKLANNQEQIVGDLDSIRNRVSENEKRIKVLEGQMVTFKNDVNKLKDIQAEHSRLIQENSLQISVLGSYVFQNLPPEEQLRALKRGDFDNQFQTKADKQDLIDKLERQTTVDTIGRTGANVSQYSAASYEFLVNTGLLKGEDAQRVGKFLNYVIAAGNIISGGAKVYNGDASGILNIMSGISILLKKPPEKSAELKFLEQMYEEMQKGFQHLDQRFDVIDKKLNAIAEQIYESQKSILNSLQIVAGELDRISWKQDILIQMSRASLFQKYSGCKQTDLVRRNSAILRDGQFEKYDDYVRFYDVDPAVGKCLEGIDDISISDNDLFFQMKTLINDNANTQYSGYYRSNAENEINQLYKPTRQLFARVYGDRESVIIPALLYPAEKINNSNLPLFYLPRTGGPAPFDSGLVLNQYLSADQINEYSELFLTYIIYFEISGDRMKPDSLDRYLAKSREVLADKNRFVKQRLERLLNLTDFAIAQQSILAGNLLIEPIYSILFTASASEEDKRAAVDALASNKLLAMNFASYLLYKNLGVRESLDLYRAFASQYEGIGKSYTRIATPPPGVPQPPVDSDGSRVGRVVEPAKDPAEETPILNRFARINDFTFTYGPDDRKIYMRISRGGKTVDLPIPLISTIPQNQMNNTPALLSLLRTRKMLTNKLLDLSVMGNLANDKKSLDILKYSFIN